MTAGHARPFRSLQELERALHALPPPPTRAGRVALIVSRHEGGRATPPRMTLIPGEGIPGDAWTRRADRDPDAQIAVMRVDVAALIANGQPLTTFGDNLLLDLDLAAASLPPGTRLRAGTAVLEVTPKAHNGCRKFQERFGPDALRFVAMPALRPLNLRGTYMRAVERGEIAVGDPVEVLGPAREAGLAPR